MCKSKIVSLSRLGRYNVNPRYQGERQSWSWHAKLFEISRNTLDIDELWKRSVIQPYPDFKRPDLLTCRTSLQCTYHWVGNKASGKFSEEAQKGLPGILLSWPGCSSFFSTCPGFFLFFLSKVYRSFGDVCAAATPDVLPRPASRSLGMRCRGLFSFPRYGKNSECFLLAGPFERGMKARI